MIQACGFIKPLAGYVFNSNTFTGERKGTLFYILENITVVLIFFFLSKIVLKKKSPKYISNLLNTSK